MDYQKQQNIATVNLVGVSLGALIGQYFASKHPTKVNSLTALGGYNINEKNNEIEKIQRASIFGFLFRAIFSIKAFRKKITIETCHSKKGQTLFYNTTSHFERKSFSVMQGQQNIVKDRENVKIDYPNLVLVGEYDIQIAIESAKKWHSVLKNSEYYVIKNGGHCANIDEPLLFNKKIKQFLDKNNSF